MEMFIYFICAITAVGGIIVYLATEPREQIVMVYSEVQNIWQQNNALKQKISILESELASLTTELKELKAKEIEEKEEE